MMKRLEADSLQADLLSVDALLRQRSQGEDPVGWFQFSQRKAELESRIADLQEDESQQAAVALYFGGRPVLGSRGILADFGAKALEAFQLIVATWFAGLEGPLADQGPVPQRERSALMITEVAHGSFGFVLEEAETSAAPELPMTSLRDVVDGVCDLFHKLATPPEDVEDLKDLEELSEALDKRVLSSLQSFFGILQNAGATLKVVEGARTVSLDQATIARVRDRTDALMIEEHPQTMTGRLFLLPDARRFELHPQGGAPSIKGAVAANALVSVVADNGEIVAGVIGSIVSVELRVRNLKLRQQVSKQSYQLLRIDLSSGPA